MKPAITVRGLGKRYRIEHRNPSRYRTLREDLTGWIRRPFSARAAESSEDFWALRDVDFEVEAGEVIGIVGRNGAGKSTLLKILSRITPPTCGEAFLRGRVGSLLEVGTGFHPELSGRENIYLSGAILGMKRKEVAARFDEIVAFAEVEKFLDTPVKRYSSGMYVRLAFGVAAHLETEILLVDEVLAVGDAQFQKKSLNKIQSVARSGRTVLFVSHNMAAIRTFCQKGVLLHQGRVLEAGEIHSVVEKYSLLGTDLAGEAWQLEERPRANFVLGGSRVTGVRVNALKPVYHGESMELEIEARLDRAFNDLAVGFGFSGMDGTRYLSYDSDLRQELFSAEAGNRLRAIVKLDEVQLQPGVYALDLGLRSGHGTTVDYLAGVLQIEVLPGPTTPVFLAQNQPGVRAGACWEIDDGNRSVVVDSRGIGR